MLGAEELEVTPDAVKLSSGEKTEILPLSFAEWKPAENSDTAVRAAGWEDGLIRHECHILTPFENVLKLSFTEHGAELLVYHNAGLNGRPAQRILACRR